MRHPAQGELRDEFANRLSQLLPHVLDAGLLLGIFQGAIAGKTAAKRLGAKVTNVYAVRFTQHADGRETYEVRYYILNRYLSGPRFGEAVRGHWGIESMHWMLDVSFREDDSRTRERTLGNNLS